MEAEYRVLFDQVIPVQISTGVINQRGQKMMMVVARDLKELKAAENSLWYQKNLLETIIDGLPDILAIQKPDHSIIRYNLSGYRALGVTPAQARGKKCYYMLGRKPENPRKNILTTEAGEILLTISIGYT